MSFKTVVRRMLGLKKQEVRIIMMCRYVLSCDLG